MLGKRPPQRELFRPDNLLLEHVGPGSYYAFLAKEGPRLFRDADFAWLYREGGRPSVPPSQLCILLMLQAREGVSDQETIDRTAFDLRWKVALGVEVEDKLCAKSTLQLFRAKLLLDERYTRLFEQSVVACRREGLLREGGQEVAIDTTPVLGAGAVRDTFNLISDAVRAVVEEACRLKGWDRDKTVRKHGLERHFGSSFKGSVELDWSDEQEKRELLSSLLEDGRKARGLGKDGLRGYASEAQKPSQLRSAVKLLEDLVGQDVELDPDDGAPRIRRGTKPDRVVSTSDPDMRHGHKSERKHFDGYKASVVAETASGVILGTDVRRGNVSDREGAPALIDRVGKQPKVKVTAVLGDTAYGDMGTRKALQARKIELVAKTQPISSRKGTFKRDAFKIDDAKGVATCPAGARSMRRRPMGDGWSYTFSRRDCGTCVLRAQCTKSEREARTIRVGKDYRELDRLRAHQKTKRFRKRYRRRVVVEHAIGRMRQRGAGKARVRGLQNVAMRFALIAAAVNLSLAAARFGGGVVCQWVEAFLIHLAVLGRTWARHRNLEARETPFRLAL